MGRPPRQSLASLCQPCTGRRCRWGVGRLRAPEDAARQPGRPIPTRCKTEESTKLHFHCHRRSQQRRSLSSAKWRRGRRCAISTPCGSEIIEALYDDQRAANGPQAAAESEVMLLGEPPAPERLRAWREVCEPHPDVLEARFSDTEFSANLALADQGEGGEEYTDSAAFFRITYATEALQRVLTTTIVRLAGKGGDPVIGLRTNFGGGKTHTMPALHHLAGAVETQATGRKRCQAWRRSSKRQASRRWGTSTARCSSAPTRAPPRVR